MLDRTEIDVATSQENSFTQRRKMDEKSRTVEPQPHLFNKNEQMRWQRKRLEKQRHMGKRCERSKRWKEGEKKTRHTTKPDLLHHNRRLPLHVTSLTTYAPTQPTITRAPCATIRLEVSLDILVEMQLQTIVVKIRYAPDCVCGAEFHRTHQRPM